MIREKWRIYQNYIIIGILSLISVFFLPMLGSELGLGFNVPNTTAGWIVWVLTKVCIMVINIMLLDQFIKQAKVNVRDNERFKEAESYYVIKEEDDEYLPTPKEFIGKLYRNKAISVAITSALGVFGLNSAILQFDWVSMLTYLFTIVFGLIFGWITMNTVEEYWTVTYYKKYKRDKLLEEEAKKKAEEEKAKALETETVQEVIADDTNREQLLQESGGVGTEEQRGYSETLAD